jgi:SpoVK/Ycf46/Vps4 family AAA+-type ATPase
MKAGGWVNMAGMSSDDGNMSAEMRKLRREVIWLGESEVRYRELFRERRWFVRFFLESAGNGDEDDAGEGKDGDEGVESAVVSHGRNDAQHQPLVQNVDFVT